MERKPGASEEAISATIARIGVQPPRDYLDFLRLSNGGTGLGPDVFINLFAAEEVGTPGLDYGAPEYAPGLIVIGGDGCGNILGIDIRQCDYLLEEDFDPDRFPDGPQMKEPRSAVGVDEPSLLQPWYWLTFAIGAVSLLGGAALSFKFKIILGVESKPTLNSQ